MTTKMMTTAVRDDDNSNDDDNDNNYLSQELEFNIAEHFVQDLLSFCNVYLWCMHSHTFASHSPTL